MKSNWPVKKLGEIVVGVVFVSFAIVFLVKNQYWQSLISIGLLIPLLKLNALRKLILAPNSGLKAEFEIPEEKIKQDIRENKKPVNKKTFINFKEIEEKVLRDVQAKIGGSMKKQIHFVYGRPPHFEFAYTPDATIQTDKELIFVEIKYISKPELADNIVNNAIKYLHDIYSDFAPVAGKKLVIKLILASSYDLDLKPYQVPEGIELEFYKL